MKVLISKKTGIFYYLNENLNSDFHCKEGFIKKEDLLSNKKILISNTNREFLFFKANYYDFVKKYKRGPQIITEKDLGYIIARSGISKDSFVVEAGSGSGAGTIFFARFVNKVHSYELKEENIKIVQKNLDFVNLDNVILKNANLKDFIEKEEENIDLLFLDMPNPDEVLNKNLSKVKKGGFIVCYLPSIFQVQKITKIISLREDLYLEEISEINLRLWRVWEKVCRPEFKKEIDHSAFLVFIRCV